MIDKVQNIRIYFARKARVGVDDITLAVDCPQCGYAYSETEGKLAYCGLNDGSGCGCHSLIYTCELTGRKYPPREIALSGKMDAAIKKAEGQWKKRKQK